MIKSLAQLKQDAANYTWQLYSFSFDGGKTESNHKFRDMVRTISSVDSQQFWFNTPDHGITSMIFGKASNWSFEKYLHNDVDQIVVVNVPNGPLMRYHLRPIN